MADNLPCIPGSGVAFASDECSVNGVAGVQLRLGKVTFGAHGECLYVTPTVGLPVSVLNGSLPVTGTFWPATQPVSIAATVAADPTDRAGRLLGHVTVDTMPAVSVANFPASQTVS